MVKSLERTVSKWVERAGVAGPAYEAGIREPTRQWSAGAKAAEPRWKAEITRAAAEGRYARGITTEAQTKYERKAIEVGTARYGPGVAAAQADFTSAMGPVLAFEQTVQGEVSRMPNATEAERDNRVLTWVRRMRTYKK